MTEHGSLAPQDRECCTGTTSGLRHDSCRKRVTEIALDKKGSSRKLVVYDFAFRSIFLDPAPKWIDAGEELKDTSGVRLLDKGSS